MDYKILSYYKSATIKKKCGFLGLKTDYITNTTIIKETDPEFNNISNNSDYKIHSILRFYDNKILTIYDDTDVYNGSPGYVEQIGNFYLDGYEEFYKIYLKSKSGISVAFGGGTFVDIMDFNKTPLKEIRKQKLNALKRTCNGGVS